MNFLNNKIEIHHIISVVGTYMNICHIVCLTALLLKPRIFCSALGSTLQSKIGSLDNRVSAHPS